MPEAFAGHAFWTGIAPHKEDIFGLSAEFETVQLRNVKKKIKTFCRAGEAAKEPHPLELPGSDFNQEVFHVPVISGNH